MTVKRGFSPSDSSLILVLCTCIGFLHEIWSGVLSQDQV